MRKTNDLTGQKFGRLTVLQLVENDAQNSKKSVKNGYVNVIVESKK